MSDLVIYFSRSGENYFGGVLKNIEKGNTEVIAEYIQEFTGADLFKVEPAIEYPLDYMKCIDVAKKSSKMMQDLKSKKHWKISQPMIQFILVFQTGGEHCQCRCSHNLKAWISQVKS